MVDADTVHAGILFVGLYVVIDVVVRQIVSIPVGILLALAWTVGYWLVVNYVLPPSLSGPQNTP